MAANGRNRLGVDPGGHLHHLREGAAVAHRPAAFGLGVAAGGDHQLGAGDHVGQQLAAGREPARYRDLGPVQHHGVGQPQTGADQAEGQGGVEHDGRRPGLGGQPPDAAGDDR